MIAMAKKKIAVEDMIDGLIEDMKREYSHWLYIRENGCRDPFWTDGVNMNLTRNRILYDKTQIARLCAEKGLMYRMENISAALEAPYRVEQLSLLP